MGSNWEGSNRRAELPPDWPAIRRRILARDGHRCRWLVKGERCIRDATDVDHIKPGNEHRDFNLRALCSRHHGIKTAADANTARAKLKAQRYRTPEPHPGQAGR